MKKLLLFITLIVFIPNVNALINPNLQNANYSTSARFYNNRSATERTVLYATRNIITNPNPNNEPEEFTYIAWHTDTNATCTANSYGCAIAFNIGSSFVKGNIYSLTMYFGGNVGTGNLVSPEYSKFNNRLTTGAGYNSQTPASDVNIVTNGNVNYGSIYNNYLYGYQNLHSFTITFVAEQTGSYAFVSFAPNTSSFTLDMDAYNFVYVGYELASQGTDNSGAFTNIENKIDNSYYALNDALTNSTNSINNNITESTNKIDNTLTNSDVDSPDSAFSEFESYLPENGVITNLITLPISLFQRVLNSINGSCSQYNLGNLMGTDLVLPCINISNYIGTTLWNVIDVLFSGLFVLIIGKKMIKAFNGFTSMEEGDVLD